ncbi:dihydrofolate reductase family protein [Microbacterium gorillae]|uniref:dihydrofolate reductase family protein n=1 Tax=Microbacterium gorillae TaxID=1231063 RepID=UPI000693BADD|nr:dihydrofolate reductase family protein [Microbacterium gorillae]
MLAPGTLVRVLPEHDEIDLAADGARDALARWYDSPARVRLNMITSLTGAATGADGTSDGLTSRVDRAVLGVIRRASDVVVVGAQSVRAEGYVAPTAARLAVVTVSGDLRGHNLQARDDAPAPILLCPADAADRDDEHTAGLDAEIVPLPAVIGGGLVSPRDVVAALVERNLPRIVCEGGPMLARSFVRAGGGAEGVRRPDGARRRGRAGSGDLRGHTLQARDDAPRPSRLCPADAAARVREHTAGLDAEIVPLPAVIGGGLVSPRDVVAALVERNLPRIVCEGGPMLASSFVRAGVIEEACITVAPVLTPSDAPFVSLRNPQHSTVASHAVDGAGFSYLRLTLSA